MKNIFLMRAPEKECFFSNIFKLSSSAAHKLQSEFTRYYWYTNRHQQSSHLDMLTLFKLQHSFCQHQPHPKQRARMDNKNILQKKRVVSDKLSFRDQYFPMSIELEFWSNICSSRHHRRVSIVSSYFTLFFRLLKIYELQWPQCEPVSVS